MLWSTLKLEVIEHVEDYPEHEGSKELLAQAASMNMTLKQFLDRMDIRNVYKLRELVPNAFPKSIRRSTVMLYKNSRDQWCISRK